MSKVLTFATVFPSSHPRAGQNTFFVEQILNGKKKHTIRSGQRFKAGDKFSPRVWSGRPYRSKQFTICDDLTIEEVYTIRMTNGHWHIHLDEYLPAYLSDKKLSIIASNDGLELIDFQFWFKGSNDFVGQILVWDESIDYSKFMFK